MLTTLTYPGAPDGMARYAPPHTVADTECRTLFDALIDVPGYIRRRGPLDVVGAANTSSQVIGLARTQDPAGVEQVIKLDYTTTPNGIMRGVINATMAYSWPYTPAISPQEVFDAKDALNGGVFIGTAPTYDKPAQQVIALWRGAGKDTTSATMLASSISLGDTVVHLTTGGSSFCPGHFVFNASNQLIGTVKSVSVNDLTLTNRALVTSSTTVYGTPFRGLNPRVSKGRITTDTTSAVVNGGATKFRGQGLATGTWDLFTTDYVYIGTVSSVAADAQLTLAASASVSLLNADYIAIQRDGSYSLTRAAVGYLNASFAGHQFFADSNILRFSDLTDREAVDTTTDGDYVIFSGDPIRAIVPTVDSLVVLSEREAFALSGAVGTTPDRWRGTRINDDGTICGMSAVAYKGGAIYAGKRGIYFWDGADPVNIAAKLGDDYRRFVAGADRAWGMVAKDHYFLFVEGATAGVFAKLKGATTTPYTQLTIAVNLVSGACSLFTNVGIRGWVPIPDSIGYGSVMYGIATNDTKSYVALADSLFLDDAVDDVTCLNDNVGPDFYLESKRYDLGDPQRLKLIKMLMLFYNSIAGNLKMDVMRGLEEDGQTLTGQFLSTSAPVDKRLKFMASSQMIGFRLYQSDTQGDPDNNISAACTRITLGPWAFGFKPKNPGRV